MFWDAACHPTVLMVEALPAEPGDPDAFDLARLPCAVAVRLLPGGGEQVLIGDAARCIRLEVAVGTFLNGPVRLRYRLSGFDGVEAKLLTLRRLLALWRLGRLPLSLFPPERRARRWAQALQAYDGVQAGASQREIAIVLFGRKRVEEDWSGRSDLRMRVQRLVRTAEKLIEGGYRHLLR